MALDILEWGVIAIMGASILIWGPEKVPDIAKTLGRAKKEFDGATKQLQGITKELQTGINSGNFDIDSLSNALLGAGARASSVPGNLSPGEMAQAPAGSVVNIGPNGVPTTTMAPKKSADQMLIEMAKSLRIDTQGKTREEVSQAIMERVSSPKPDSASPVEDAQTTPAISLQPTPAETPQTEPGETPAAAVVQQQTEAQTGSPAAN
jgi:sec-independent protein translocase protein TatA